MIRILLLLALGLPAAPATAQPVWNQSPSAAPLHRGPNALEPVVGLLGPGESAQVTTCDAMRRWCLVSTDALVGWVDTDAVPLPVRGGSVAARPVAPAPRIEVTPLPGTGGRVAAPLPDAILDAVPPARPAVAMNAPGARRPLILSVTAPMRNVTDGLVNLRAGPGTEHPVTGGLQPGEGGVIDICDRWERWCLIEAPGGPGWVKMTLVGERRLAVGAR